MAEKDKIFSSKVKHGGYFSFADFYKFCHDWLADEQGLNVAENKYVEKLSGDSKNIDIAWTGTKALTDYFKFEVKVNFKVVGLKKVEIVQNGVKVKTNDGGVEVAVTGTLIKDYQGKFESSAWTKFTRGIYEKWVITAGISQMEDKLSSLCDGFLGQVKAYLALEGRK